MSLHIDEHNFNSEVLKSKQTVLLDFWAPWCGPCRMLSPVLVEFSKEQEGKVKIAKVNIDEQPGLAAKFGVMSIPTLVVFKDGQVTNQSVGLMPKHALEMMITG